jgi:hypothetical protein
VRRTFGISLTRLCRRRSQRGEPPRSRRPKINSARQQIVDPGDGAGSLKGGESDGRPNALSPAGRPRRSLLKHTANAGLVEKTSPAQSERRGSDDVLVESVLLAYIVYERPEGVLIPMLALRFSAEFDQDLGGSAIERAVRELVCDGRLQMQGGKVVPGPPPEEAG